jgi:hypothetical protein
MSLSYSIAIAINTYKVDVVESSFLTNQEFVVAGVAHDISETSFQSQRLASPDALESLAKKFFLGYLTSRLYFLRGTI